MRKQFKTKLSDGKEYIFAERNKEDVDFSHLQEATRQASFERIKNYQDKKLINEEMADALRVTEFGKVYNDMQISSYINSSNEEILKLVYSSFKVYNPEIDFEKFKQLLNVPQAKSILNDITELEKGEPMEDKECASILKMKLENFKKLAKEQPGAYQYLKYNLKKSPGKG